MNEYKCESTGITKEDLDNYSELTLALERGNKEKMNQYTGILSSYGSNVIEVIKHFTSHILECDSCDTNFAVGLLKKLSKEKNEAGGMLMFGI